MFVEQHTEAELGSTVPKTVAEAEAAAATVVATTMSNQQLKQFLVSNFPALLRHVNWFFRTQRSDQSADDDAMSATTFAWKGRSKDHCMASGLDDYPRASFLTPEEGHVDLHAWMIMLSQLVRDLAQWLAKQPEEEAEKAAYYSQLAEQFQTKAADLSVSLDALHWHDKARLYCDYAYANDTLRFIGHRGYVALFPFFLGVLSPSSPQLNASLTLLQSPGLWSPYGIRSLSTKDKLFGSKENYWRGNTWININFLILSSLHNYAARTGPYQVKAGELYTKLRQNLIRNLFNEYKRTGYLWEQYNALDGKGLRSHPFTGWTALIVLIMAEKY